MQRILREDFFFVPISTSSYCHNSLDLEWQNIQAAKLLDSTSSMEIGQLQVAQGTRVEDGGTIEIQLINTARQEQRATIKKKSLFKTDKITGSQF